MHATKESKIILFYFGIIALWWTALYLLGIKYSFQNYLYQFGFGLIPLVGGFLGILKSKKWGFLNSQVGTAIFFISLGLISWGVGQMLWSLYYNILLQVEVPYPSLADIGYVGALPLWIFGIISFSKATGAKFSLENVRGKLMLFGIPILAVAFSYYLLIVVARGGSIPLDGGALKLFFDFAYPVGDIVILTLALLIYGLSFGYLGGRFRIPIITILAGFALMYLTDFTFSYVTTIESYYNGHFVDLMFPAVMTLLTFGVNNMDPDIKDGSKGT